MVSFFRKASHIGRQSMDGSWCDVKYGETGQDSQHRGGSTSHTTVNWNLPAKGVSGAKYWCFVLLPAVALVLAGLAALSIDVPLSRCAIAINDVDPAKRTKALRQFCELLDMSETFGHGIGVAMLALAVFMLDPARRWALPRMLIVTYGAGLAANIGKMLIARTRPRDFDLVAGNVWQTFESSFLFGAGGRLHQSFPSAHTATAVAFALVLSCLYPHARRLFMALAVLVAMQRLQCGAHFLSDICGGAALGWLFAAGSFRFAPFTRLMDRLETGWACGKQ
jgi:membrane-associated phospholipid phosphatase